MVSTLRHCLLGALTIAPFTTLVADKVPIIIDGRFDDWDTVPVFISDPDDVAPGSVDFGRMWIAEDNTYLFIRVETGAVVDPSENNNLVLFVNGGAGRELEWQLGTRTGVFRNNGIVVNNSVRYADIGFRCMPTLDTNDFELAIRLDARPDGTTGLFSGTTIKIQFTDTLSEDQIPNNEDGISYTFGTGDLPEETFIDFEKERSTDLRIATYNVLNDNIFDSSLWPGFRRQLQAIQPDIIHFQEIRSNTASGARALAELWLPLPDGQSWSAVGGVGNENSNVTVSRFPIIDDWGAYTPWAGDNLFALIDTTALLGTETLVVNTHLPSGANDLGRQREVDSLMTMIRDVKRPDRPRSIINNTPIIIAGDMNFVGRTGQLNTLLTGDIEDNNFYGIDSVPDWDDTHLTSITPKHSDQRMGYTWRSEQENNFWPGHLDYIIYSDSVLSLIKSFVVHTPSMSASRLEAYNLQSSDSLVSDHLIFVADFRPAFVDTDGNGLPDFWENLVFGDIGTTEAATDKDFDGLSNLQEYHVGTDPNDDQSRLEVLGTYHSEGQTTIQWTTVVDRNYLLQESSDLTNWSDIADEISGTGQPAHKVIPMHSEKKTFFRILVK